MEKVILTEEVTRRPLEDYLFAFDMSLDNLVGKKIVDIGAGLADFSREINQNEKLRNKGTVCIAVDPVYKDVAQTDVSKTNPVLFRSLKKSIKNQIAKTFKETATLTDYSIERHFSGREISDKENRDNVVEGVRQIKTDPNKTYVSADARKLPIAGNTVDLVLMQNFMFRNHLLDVDSNDGRAILREAVRIIDEHGEIRIVPLRGLGVIDDKLSVWCEGEYEPEPDYHNLTYFERLERDGMKFYLVETSHHTRTLIIRKDDEWPSEFSDPNKVTVKKLNFSKLNRDTGEIDYTTRDAQNNEKR
jgi:ubiquinone/menaquinone biosynthesis C-methylase UbiE